MTGVKGYSNIDHGHKVVYTVHMEMPEESRRILGERVKAARTDRRLSQARLGRMAGLDGSYVSKVEGATMLNPTRDSIGRLAAAMDLPFEALWPMDEAPQFARRSDVEELAARVKELEARGDLPASSRHDAVRLEPVRAGSHRPVACLCSSWLVVLDLP